MDMISGTFTTQPILAKKNLILTFQKNYDIS